MKMTLTLFDDGRALLATEDDIDERQAQEIQDAFRRWRETPEGLVIMQGTVEHAKTLEIDLPVA